MKKILTLFALNRWYKLKIDRLINPFVEYLEGFQMENEPFINIGNGGKMQPLR